MKKLMNDPSLFVEQSLGGLLAAYPDAYTANAELRALIYKAPPQGDAPAIIIGGGAGHLPLFLGYIGDGLCTAAATGNIFSTPSAKAVAWLSERVPSQNGILYIVGNFTGDIMNFAIAAEQAAAQGIRTKTVIVSDDVATAPREDWRSRRCVSGVVFVYKIAGAAARLGKGLDEIVAIAERANANLASIGFAYTSCQLPDAKAPIFAIGDDEMEIGIGIHGEPGVRRVKQSSSEELAADMAARVAEDLTLKPGERVAMLVNGLGGISQEELFILYRDLKAEMDSRGVTIDSRFIGSYCTSLGMNGASVSVLRLDDELSALLKTPARSPFVSF